VQSIRNKRFAHAYCSHFKTKKRKSHMETPACVCRSCQFTRSFRAFYSSCAQAQKAKSKKWVGKGVRARVITHAHQVLIPIGVRIERERERERERKGVGRGGVGGFTLLPFVVSSDNNKGLSGIRLHALTPQSLETKEKIREAGCTCEHQPRLVTVLNEEVATSTRSICDFCIFGSPPEP
jgi:hypothetical protein